MMMKVDRRKEIKGISYNVLAPLDVLSDFYGGSWGKWTGLAQDSVQRERPVAPLGKTQMSFPSATGRGRKRGIVETALPLIFGGSFKVAGGRGHVSWIKAFSAISPRLSGNLA